MLGKGMAGVAGLQQAHNINGCDTAGQHSSPANTAGNPAECRTFEDRLDKIEAMVTDLFRQLRNVRERAKNEEQEGQQRDQRLADVPTITDVRQLHSRINRIVERVDGIEETADTARRETNVLAIAANQTTERITAVETARAWIDTFEVKQVADAMNAAIDEIGARQSIFRKQQVSHSQRISELETAAVCDPIISEDFAERFLHLTEAVQQLQADAIDRNERELNAAHEAMAAKQRNHPDRPTCGDPDCGQCYDQRPAKRTIKGGWANVYSTGNIHAHETREEADQMASGNRLACIQIPDITEGEGL